MNEVMNKSSNSKSQPGVIEYSFMIVASVWMYMYIDSLFLYKEN